ncbi:hypothetical protein [Bradyrhizobium sp. 1]|uniref:hypothetical protein n=1 Tax=Bradyrhizobium sp. 1 TaxID=241591 RepID=UPI001FFB7920|nr:hypothetical protein [Bradyrhizobium sp. 1]MCK1393973.1 hypothetical protein [Bradyrhizobium sp. 1]
MQRRRFKQTTSLQERIGKFSEKVRRQVETAPDAKEKETLLKRLRCADTAAMLEKQLSSK